MWTQSYDELLLEWSALRKEVQDLPLEEALRKVHDWANTAPIVSNTVHFTDPDNWPLPWDLLSQPAYCDVAKCLLMCYTLLLIQHNDIKSLHMVQDDNYTYVQINEGEYTLNDQPDQITMDQSDLRVKFSYNCEDLKSRIQ
jgi:hypothetical protein